MWNSTHLTFQCHNYLSRLSSLNQSSWNEQLKIQYQMICFSSDHTLASYQVDVLLASVLQLWWRCDFPPERSCAGRRPGSRYSSWWPWPCRWCGTRSGNLRHTLCHITNSRRSRFGRIGTPPKLNKKNPLHLFGYPCSHFQNISTVLIGQNDSSLCHGDWGGLGGAVVIAKSHFWFRNSGIL